jgi:hypothetical protein
MKKISLIELLKDREMDAGVFHERLQNLFETLKKIINKNENYLYLIDYKEKIDWDNMNEIKDAIWIVSSDDNRPENEFNIEPEFIASEDDENWFNEDLDGYIELLLKKRLHEVN